MDFKQLQAMGAIVPRNLVKKVISFTRPALKPQADWTDPSVPEASEGTVDESVTAYIRRRSSADFLEIVGTDSPVDKSLIAIQRSVCDEEGAPVFADLDQVRQLAPWLLIPLMNAVTEVNRFGEKKSTPRGSSGSSLRSPSADAASPNGRKRSPKKSGRSG